VEEGEIEVEAALRRLLTMSRFSMWTVTHKAFVSECTCTLHMLLYIDFITQEI
jgi:hypothetical protein